jgi:hypothetical protein
MDSVLSETREFQLEFWTAFAEALGDSSFPSRKPAAKNWCYLPIGTSRARVVAVVDLAKNRVGCKLALRHPRGDLHPGRAQLIFGRLRDDRAAIESELGFSDLEWGAAAGTRIYRYADAAIQNRDSWPEVFLWLISCAERFKQVFAPRIGQMEIAGSATVTKAFAAVDALAEWSPWIPIAESHDQAPREPGVYMARTRRRGPVIYVGMAGERSGKGTRKPQGLNGRLSAYLSGQSLGGGLLGRAYDLALNDPVWLAQRINDLEAGENKRAKDWGKAALQPHDLHVRWVTCEDRADAAALEKTCLTLLRDVGLWNFQE